MSKFDFLAPRLLGPVRCFPSGILPPGLTLDLSIPRRFNSLSFLVFISESASETSNKLGHWVSCRLHQSHNLRAAADPLDERIKAKRHFVRAVLRHLLGTYLLIRHLALLLCPR